jgi:hypothetical protein
MNFPDHQRYRQARTVTWIIIVVHAVFIMATPLFPFVDLPNHLAEATIYKYHGEAGNSLASYYAPVPWYFPNTFHTVFCGLLTDVEVGNRIFMVLYVLALQLSLFLTIRQLKGNPWYGLLGIVFTFNYNVTFGFVGFAISIPAVILLFYLVLRDIEKDTVALKVAIAFLFILIFLMHAQNALFALVLYGLMTLYAYWHAFPKLLLRAVFVPLPLLILIVTWWIARGSSNEESTSGFLLSYYRDCFLPEFLSRMRFIIFDNYQLQAAAPGVLIAVAFFLSTLVPVLYFKPWQQERWKDFFNAAIYPLIFFVSALCCYFILPTSLPGQSPLSQRFCTFVNLALVIVLSVFMRNAVSAKLRNYAVVVCSIYTLLWFEYIFSFNVENKSFRPDFFAGTNNDNKLAALIYDNTYRRSKVYIHFPNYFIVWKHGIAATKIIDYRFGVVRRVALESEVPFYDEYVGDNYKHHHAYRGQDFLLVRGEAPVSDDLNLRNSSKVRESGEWKLYKNSPDVSFQEETESIPVVKTHQNGSK